MSQLVMDASVTLTWLYPDETSVEAYEVLDALADATAMVPSIWTLEIANAVLVGERRQRLATADVSRFLGLIEGLRIERDEQTSSRALAYILPLARGCGLSAYDAAYLELAARVNLPLATLDEKLKRAAESSGVGLFEARQK